MKTNIACERFRGVAIAEDSDYVRVAQLRCKQWDCRYCAEKNALQWRASIIDYVVNNPSKWSFVTITLPSWIHKIKDEQTRNEEGLLFIKFNSDKLMQRLRRWLGKIQYIRVIETHRSGVPHIHMLIDTWIPDSELRERSKDDKYYHSDTLEKHLKELKFGYIHDARNLETPLTSDNKYHAGSVAMYITKYMTKDSLEIDKFRKGLRVRKIQTSRGIKRLNLESEYDWKLRSALMREDYDKSDKKHFDVTTGQVITDAHFRDGIAYPPDDREI